MSSNSKRVYFLVPAPVGISPSQRFRFEHYLKLLEEKNIQFRFSSFYSAKDWGILYKKGMALKKMLIVFKGFGRRMFDMFRLSKYDYIFIHREAAPVGPPLFEWIIAKILRKKIIYDFDDAIWIPVSSKYNKLAGPLRWFSKVGSICKWSHWVSAGNENLAAYASKFTDKVRVVPTVVDTDHTHKGLQNQLTNTPVVGWTGTFSTLKYLDIILPVLEKLQKKLPFLFILIADKDPELPLNKYKFVKWQKERETEDLLQMHIGLMPLYDDEISKGKCGFKAIQYMSLGIPAIVSPVGVNTKIVDDGINGFVCDSSLQWEDRLTEMLLNPELRVRMGASGQKKIEEQYSVRATQGIFLDLFN